MIAVNNLRKGYGEQLLFDNCSFQLNKGERVGIVGRNGHGKTTLLRIITGVEEADSGTIETPKGYRLGYLDQHLSFSKQTILAEACTGLRYDDRYDTWKVEKTLTGLGFTPADFARSPAEFSGGYQVRLHLAKVLAGSPDCLLLDEPTNYLDVVAIRWFIRFLRGWKGEVLVVTHDRSFMDQVTTHTIAIHRQAFRKIEGGTAKLYEQIAQDEEVYERTRKNIEKKRAQAEQFITRFRAKARLAGMVQSRIKQLAKQERPEKLQAIEDLDFNFPSLPFPGRNLLGADGLSFGYDEHPRLIKNLSLHLSPNDRIGVVGPNGKGKTTLLKLLAGRLQPQAGTLRPHPDMQIGYYEQTNINTLQPERTVVDEIGADAECLPQRARDIGGIMMFRGDHGLKKIKVLSGGERSRVLLGKLLAKPSHVLLLDEPTNHLDMESCDSLLAALDNYGGAVIIVTHNEMFLRTLANRLIVFDRGKVFLYEGGYQRFLDDIGWAGDERAADSGAAATPVSIPRGDRQARARYVQERSKALKPLQQRVKQLEKDIVEHERQGKRVDEELVAASISNDPERIAGLSKQRHELVSAIDALYRDLDAATKSFEKEQKKWQ